MTDSNISQAPFLKIILPVTAGLVLSTSVSLNPLITGICCAALMILAWIFRKQKAGQGLTWATIALFFFTSAEASEPRGELPEGERIVAAVQIKEISSVRGRWQHTTADVGFWRPASRNEKATNAGPQTGRDIRWRKVGERIQLSVDTTYHIEPGMQIALRGWLNPIDTTNSSYGRLMQRRGYHSRIYLTPGNLLRESPYISKTPGYYASRLHEAAAAKLDRLDLSDASKAVVGAMTAGDRRNIHPRLRQNYNLSGGAHLLAVSGLHVGIVFMLLNAILYLLPSLRRGHLIKNIIAIAGIWLYATVTGLAPSVVRAALMFSFAQLALASSSGRNALNIMLGSAVVMLGINPNLAGDPSFLLSYTAVLSILLFFRPLYSLVKTRYKAVNALSSIIIAGLTATIGTAPLVSHWFGNLSFIGILINPAVILTANIIVLGGVLWLSIPGDALSGVFSFILEYSARVQNSLIEWSANQKWAILAGNTPLWSVFLCYSIILLSALIIYKLENNTIPQTVNAK